MSPWLSRWNFATCQGRLVTCGTKKWLTRPVTVAEWIFIGAGLPIESLRWEQHAPDGSRLCYYYISLLDIANPESIGGILRLRIIGGNLKRQCSHHFALLWKALQAVLKTAGHRGLIPCGHLLSQTPGLTTAQYICQHLNETHIV